MTVRLMREADDIQSSQTESAAVNGRVLVISRYFPSRVPLLFQKDTRVSFTFFLASHSKLQHHRRHILKQFPELILVSVSVLFNLKVTKQDIDL